MVLKVSPTNGIPDATGGERLNHTGLICHVGAKESQLTKCVPMTLHVGADAKAPLVNAESHKGCHKQRQARLQWHVLHQRRIGVSARRDHESSIHRSQDEQIEAQLSILQSYLGPCCHQLRDDLPKSKLGSGSANCLREANEEVDQI